MSTTCLRTSVCTKSISFFKAVVMLKVPSTFANKDSPKQTESCRARIVQCRHSLCNRATPKNQIWRRRHHLLASGAHFFPETVGGDSTTLIDNGRPKQAEASTFSRRKTSLSTKTPVMLGVPTTLAYGRERHLSLVSGKASL